MSRVVWGHQKDSNGSTKKQTSLESFGVKQVPLRRDREDDLLLIDDTKSINSNSSSTMLLLQQAIQVSVANGEDGVQWGPSGGRDRETQNKRQQRPFMMGKERSAAFDKSSYSRDFIREWQNLRTDSENKDKQEEKNNQNSTAKKQQLLVKQEENNGIKREVKMEKNQEQEDADENFDKSKKVFMATSSKGTTEMDPALIAARFLGPTCPRDLFQGKCFFLNSCDADPIISVYQLEKVIRYLGGTTSMGVSTRVSYILTQHLSSAKEAKLLRDFDEVRGLDTNGTKKNSSMQKGNTVMKTVTGESGAGGFPKCVHPHFVLACCREGRIVPLDKFLTTPKCLANNAGMMMVGKEEKQKESKIETSKKKKQTNNEVIEID
jgi:hypothetical protein